MRQEAQTLIDECADGTWDWTLLLGSCVHASGNASTFESAAAQVAEALDAEDTADES